MSTQAAFTDTRLAELAAECPALRLLTEPGDLEHYGRDWTRRWTPAPLAIALPGTADEVQIIVRWANRHRVAIVPSGGRTGLSGGAVAAQGELVLSLERMNRVLGFDPVDRTLTVQPGISPWVALLCGLFLGTGTTVLTRIARRARQNKGLD